MLPQQSQLQLTPRPASLFSSSVRQSLKMRQKSVIG
jgi:hypothetical protein